MVVVMSLKPRSEVLSLDGYFYRLDELSTRY